MVKPHAPRVVISAGPNGAGKSTHADAIVAALGINTFEVIGVRFQLNGVVFV